MKLIKSVLTFASVAIFSNFASAQEAKSSTVSGYTMDYNAQTRCGCVFVDPEMVGAEVAESIAGKTNKVCISAKYGEGAPIDFTKVSESATYHTPKDNLLMMFHGYWGVKSGIKTYFVAEIEPFF